MFRKSTKHNKIEIRSIEAYFLFFQHLVPSTAPHLEINFPAQPSLPSAAPAYIRYRIDVCSPNLLKFGVRCFFHPTSMPARFGLNRIKNKKNFPATSVSRVEQAAWAGKGAPPRG